MDLLLNISLRALIPAAIAGAALGIGRVKTAAVQHAVWTAAMLCMLLSLGVAPLLPPIPVRVLPSDEPVAVQMDAAPAVSAPVVVAITPARPIPWRSVLGGIYVSGALISLLRLAFGYAFAKKLVREARHLESEICESGCISVPLTVGWLRPRILLPPAWRDWDEHTLGAVLAHERSHVRRGDWAIAGVAAVNRSLFWFHPLAWWLERNLASLAEQAADDAALVETADRARYAQVLWEMAAAVSAGRGRMVWETIAMAKTVEVRMRINRILDETRQIPMGLSRRWRAGLLALGLPLAYAAAVLQVAPVLAVEQVRKEAPAPTPQASMAAAPANEQAPAPQRAATVSSLTPVTRVEPEYPRLARVTGASGTVELIATVALDGHVTHVQLVHGPPMLQKAAADAAMQWNYGAQPAETQTRAFVNFPGADSSQPVSGGIQQAVLISKKDPVYPPDARQAGAKGIVELVATIGTDGHVKAARTVHGAPVLAQAAEEAVLQWRYKPTMLNGTAVESQTQVFVNFLGEPAAATPPGSFQPAELVTSTEPIHPGGELQSLGGTIVFRARVGVDGRLANIRVTDGPAELVPAALVAVKQWVYSPAKADGQPVESDIQIRLPFTPGR